MDEFLEYIILVRGRCDSFRAMGGCSLDVTMGIFEMRAPACDSFSCTPRSWKVFLRSGCFDKDFPIAV